MVASFERFFNSVVRPKLSNSIIETEWTYFVALMKNFQLERERVEMYLKILESEQTAQASASRPVLGTLSNFNLVGHTHKGQPAGPECA